RAVGQENRESNNCWVYCRRNRIFKSTVLGSLPPSSPIYSLYEFTCKTLSYICFGKKHAY
ncbi:hypothetical protein COCCADRAFT_98958, partial [Bipolaris zeicola 26-R-13]